ncbi:MAG: alpha-L-fucosidase [Bacteroidia bacterium]|nr:alpha-L-fucosidase [Bacteroidia bacterium]
MKRLFLIYISFTIILFHLSGINSTQAQSKINQNEIEKKMKWFEDAKLGIFIHWGIYAVKGVGESWSFHNKQISYDDYLKMLDGFTAKNYDPSKWADLIRQSGARYCVITSKHHDGVALWDTRLSDLSIPARTPAKRDVLSPFVDALRKDNLKVGLYFSLLDWSHPDYPEFLKDQKKYDKSKDPQRWAKYLIFCHGQINELSEKFNPDLFWFDGDWEHSVEEWQAADIRKGILEHNPAAIINGRLMGYGDYETPEQNFPVSRPSFRWWELCMTMNDSWGYYPTYLNYKTPYEIITIFADVISNGGNLLLDIGPREDGTIDEKQVNILQELGKWTKKHEEAIFGTLAGLPSGHFYGPSTISKDSSIIYLFVPGKISGDIMIKGLDTKIKEVNVIGNDHSLNYKIVGKISWSSIPGLVFITVPENQQDEYMTVVRVKLENKLKLYRGKGGL